MDRDIAARIDQAFHDFNRRQQQEQNEKPERDIKKGLENKRVPVLGPNLLMLHEEDVDAAAMVAAFKQGKIILAARNAHLETIKAGIRELEEGTRNPYILRNFNYQKSRTESAIFQMEQLLDNLQGAMLCTDIRDYWEHNLDNDKSEWECKRLDKTEEWLGEQTKFRYEHGGGPSIEFR